MTDTEIQQLAAGDLVEVGAHTVTHPVLAQLSREEQQKEIRDSKQALEQVVNRPVTSFAYPFGCRSDYTSDTVTAVREAGFQCAASNYPGLIRPRADRFQLPRYVVRNWDGDVFRRHLCDWLSEW